ncbi:MAG: hypothetical protein Q8P13_02690 [bacterium]|nr:hypothetical protein [bacterium]
MCLEVESLNVQAGDRRRKIKTDTDKDRAEVAELIEKKRRDGAVIFISVNGDDFKVEGYDQAEDELIVRKNSFKRGGRQTFNVPANGASIKIVPPNAGG